MIRPLQYLGAAGLLAGWLAAPSAAAFDIRFQSGSFQAGDGGEFVAVTSTSFLSYYHPSALQTVGGVKGFSTFCLERSEHINFGQTYSGALNDRALNGGIDTHELPNLTGDPISLGTAWLYSQFAAGSLTGYDYGTAPYSSGETASRKGDADTLQKAIWMLEDELPMDATNFYVSLASTKLGGLAAAQASSGGAYGVKVINVTEGSTRRQDALVKVPDGGSTALMMGAAVAALAWRRRRVG